MTYAQVQRISAGKIHHYCEIVMKDLTVVKGHFQPNDEEFLYITLDKGAKGVKLKISDVTRLEFPNMEG